MDSSLKGRSAGGRIAGVEVAGLGVSIETGELAWE